MVRPPGDHSGGIVGLREFVTAHAEAVEADLQRFYGLALSDLCAGRVTWRRLGVLVRRLPRESATAAEVGGDQLRWGATEHLVASVLEVLMWANWQRGGGKGPRPKPVARPGMPDRKTRIGRTERSRSEIRAYLAQFRPRNEEVTHAGNGR